MNATQHNTNTNETMRSEFADSKREPLLNPHPTATHGFAQTYGLLPGMALLTFVVDCMLFAGEGVSLGTSLPFSITAGVILGVITFLAQRKWYGDDSESAFIKALILAFLTAIPTPLPAFLYVPAGIVGLFRRKER